MAKAGRKRKTGKREPNGRASRVGAGDAMRVVVLAQPHRACLPAEARRDHRAESALGRLFLTGRITQAECEAGERLAGRKAAFDRALASPPPVRSAAGQMVAERLTADDAKDLPNAETRTADIPLTEEERAERALAGWSSAEALVWGAVRCSRHAFSMVMRVVVEGLDLDRRAGTYVDDLGAVRAALGSLAVHWGLDEEARAASAHAGRLRVAVDGVEIRREKRRLAG